MAQAKFYGQQIQARIEAEMTRRIRACCILLVNHAKVLISIEGAGVRTSAYKSVSRKVSKSKGSLIYGANPSKPGEPPHKQTGRLLGSIAFEMVSSLLGRVGTNLKYGRWLELGTRKMAARPWLRRALVEKQAEIKAILGAPMKSAA